MKKLMAIVLAMLLSTAASATALAAIQFTDVAEDAWYYNDLCYAVETGLVSGKAPDLFAPNDNLTYAEAIKLAACMHQYAKDGSVSLVIGRPWYQTYVNYSAEVGITTKTYDYEAIATRWGYIEIFANALASEALPEINYIPDGSISDVPMTASYAPAVYKLYRAGVLTGVDDAHNCNPDASITRAEVAAIITRMMKPEERQHFTTGDNDNIPFDIIPVSKQQTIVYEADKEFTLEVTTNAPVGVSVDYQWIQCDANGNSLGGHPLSFGNVVNLSIPASENGVVKYYLCTVMANNTRKQMLFSCVLADVAEGLDGNNLVIERDNLVIERNGLVIERK